MARPGRWSRTWTGILAPVRSRKSPCPAAGLRKGSLLAVVLALQVLGLPVPDHVFGVAIPVATTGFPQPVRPLCYDEGVLVRVCSRIGGRPHLAARRGGGAGRASAQVPGRCRRVCWQHLDQPALADGGRRRSAVLAHLGAGVARGRWAGRMRGARHREVEAVRPADPGDSVLYQGSASLDTNSAQASPDGMVTKRPPASSSSPDSTASGASSQRRCGWGRPTGTCATAGTGGGHPRAGLRQRPPRRGTARHRLGRPGRRSPTWRETRRRDHVRAATLRQGSRAGSLLLRVVPRVVCTVVPIVVPISRAVSSIGRAADF